MNQNDHIERIEEGRAASMAESYIVEKVGDMQDQIIERLCALYRSKDYSHAAYVGAIGELVALRGLISSLEYTVKQGNVSAQKEFGNV